MADSEIHPAVRKAVLEWADAPNVRHSAKALDAARKSIDPALLGELKRHVARVQATSAIQLLNAPTAPGPTTRVGAMELTDEQQKVLAGWVADANRTAKALGMSYGAWMHELDVAMTRMMAEAETNEGRGDKVERVVASEPRVIPTPTVAGAGVASQLAARFRKS